MPEAETKDEYGETSNAVSDFLEKHHQGTVVFMDRVALRTAGCKADRTIAAMVAAAEAAVKVIYRATPMVDGDDATVDKVVHDLADDMDAVRNQLTAAIAAAKEE